MRKLTDEELSRVLSMHAVGKLHWGTYGTPDAVRLLSGCACVAGVALNTCPGDEARPPERTEFSVASMPPVGGKYDYSDLPGADDLLRFLESRGLA
jgi:hypothetical protein